MYLSRIFLFVLLISIPALCLSTLSSPTDGVKFSPVHGIDTLKQATEEAEDSTATDEKDSDEDSSSTQAKGVVKTETPSALIKAPPTAAPTMKATKMAEGGHNTVPPKQSQEESAQDAIEELLDTPPVFSLSLDYLTHNAYRGRDGGTNQNYSSVAAEYRFSSGFVFSGDFLITDSAKIDGADLGVAFERELSETVDWSLEYSHSWYSSASKRVKANLHDALSTQLSITSGNFTTSPAYSLYIGSATESTLSWSNQYSIVFTPYGAATKITLEPQALGNWGSENQTLIQERLAKKGKKTVLEKKKGIGNYFGILDYELSLPFKVVSRNITIQAGPTLLVPYNIADGSTTSSFVSYDIGVSITFR